MDGHMETVTVTDAATGSADTATAAVTMVTTEDAARLAGVSVRTIRRWIQHGHLPAVESDRGKLVSPADIPEARTRAGRGHGHGHILATNGHDRGHNNMTADTDTAMTAPALSSATAQMEAIRDQWLLPLVDRIGSLERENGRLEQERDQVTRERDALRAELQAARETPATSPHDDITPKTSEIPKTSTAAWRRWWRRMTGGAVDLS
jgi:excisionase family DNA binding protein